MVSKILPSYVALICSALLYGFTVFGAKIMSLNGFSLIEILIIPNLIVVLALAIFVRPEFKKFYGVPLGISLLYFLAIVVCQIGQFTPIFLGLSVSMTVFLLYSQPLWTTLISIILGTRFTHKDAVLIVITFTGLVFLLAPWKEFSFSVWGFVLALLGGISLSLWIVISSRYYVKQHLKPTSITFFTNIYQSVPFMLALPLFQIFGAPQSLSAFSINHASAQWVFVFIYSLFVFVGAQILFYKAAKKINAIHLGLVLLLEPLVALMLDTFFLGTPLTAHILFGGALIMAANAYLIIQSAHKEIKE